LVAHSQPGWQVFLQTAPLRSRAALNRGDGERSRHRADSGARLPVFGSEFGKTDPKCHRADRCDALQSADRDWFRNPSRRGRQAGSQGRSNVRPRTPENTLIPVGAVGVGFYSGLAQSTGFFGTLVVCRASPLAIKHLVVHSSDCERPWVSHVLPLDHPGIAPGVGDDGPCFEMRPELLVVLRGGAARHWLARCGTPVYEKKPWPVARS